MSAKTKKKSASQLNREIDALERAGLLKVSRNSADELVGELTQAGAIAARTTKEP